MRARSQSQSETASNNSTNISLQRSYIQQKKIKSIQQIINQNYGGNAISSQSITSQSRSSQNSFNTNKSNKISSQTSNKSLKNDNNSLNEIKDKEDYPSDQNLYYISGSAYLNQGQNNRYECDMNYQSDQLELKNRSFSSYSNNDINTKRALQDSYSNLNTIEDYQKLIPDSINISYNFRNKSQNNQLSNQIKRSELNEGNKENTFMNNNVLQQEFLNDEQNQKKNFNNNSASNYLNSINKTTKYYESNSNKESDQCYPVKQNHLLLQAQKQNNKQQIKQSNKNNPNYKTNLNQKSATVERNTSEKLQKKSHQINNSKKVSDNKEKRNQSSHQGLSSAENISQSHLNLSQQINYSSLQKISKYLNRSLVELNSQRNEQQLRNNNNILYHSLNQNQIDEYIKGEQAKEYLRQNQFVPSQEISRERDVDKRYLSQYQGSSQVCLSETLPLDIISHYQQESTDKEVLIKMREIIHQLQSRDACHRLEISKLKKQNQELKESLQIKEQEKHINEYQIQKDGEYIKQLDSEINQFQQKVSNLQKQVAEEQNKQQTMFEDKNEIIDRLQHENNQLINQIQQLIENQQEQLQKIEMYQYMDQYQNKIAEQDEINLSNIERGLNYNHISNSNMGEIQLINSEDEQEIMSTSSLNNSMKQKDRIMMMQTQNINLQNNNNNTQINTLEATCNYFPNEEDIIREQAEEDEQSERTQYNQGYLVPSSSQRGSQTGNTNRSQQQQEYNNISQLNNFQNPTKNINVNLQTLIQSSKQSSTQQSNTSLQQLNKQQKQNTQQFQSNSGKNNSLSSSLNNSMSLREQINKKCNNFFINSSSLNQNNGKLLSIQSPNGQLLPLDSSILYKQQSEKREIINTPSQACIESNKVITSTTQMNISFSSPPSSCSSTVSNEFRRDPYQINNNNQNSQENQFKFKQNNQSNGILNDNRNILQPISQNIAQFKQQNRENKGIQNFDFKSYFQSLNKNEQTDNNSQTSSNNNNVDPNQIQKKQNIFIQSNQPQQNIKKCNVFSSKSDKENHNLFSNYNQLQMNNNNQITQLNNNQQLNFDKKNQQIQQIDNFEQRQASVSSKSSFEQENQINMNEQILKNYNSQQSNKDGIDIDPYQFITEEMTNNTNSECRYNDDCNQEESSQNENQDISLSYKSISDNDELSQGISNQSNDFGDIQGELTEEQTQTILKILKQKLESEYTFDDDLLEQINQQ